LQRPRNGLASAGFKPGAIRDLPSFVLLAECMSEPAPTPQARTQASAAGGTSAKELERVFNEMRVELVSTLFYFLGSYEDAEDAAHEAFVKCWRGLESMTDVRNLRAWIFRVGLNAAKDLQRNAWRKRARPLVGPSTLVEGDGLSPVEAAEEREEKERLRQALLSLRSEEKEVFLLRQNAGLTYEEIAKLRGSPVGTVKTQMRAALAKLRQALEEK
jgi:RNA polymerase sigma-70 factor, ECF subfamily